MDFNSQDPLQDNSQSEINLIEEEEDNSLSSTETNPSNNTYPILSIISNPIESAYNKADFRLDSNIDSKIYIFANQLFTRTLLPINLSKDREIEVKCTRYLFTLFLFINY
jgi:hypothetical protein